MGNVLEIEVTERNKSNLLKSILDTKFIYKQYKTKKLNLFHLFRGKEL